MLISKGAKIDAEAVNGITALMMAAREGQLQAVLLLMQHGANVNHVTETATRRSNLPNRATRKKSPKCWSEPAPRNRREVRDSSGRLLGLSAIFEDA